MAIQKISTKGFLTIRFGYTNVFKMMQLGIVLLLSFATLLSAQMHIGGKTLIMSQAVWRHGDRSPTKTYPGDPFQEDAWTFGGSGWGQLSPTGMMQHVKLGKKIRKMYVEDSGFLKGTYDSHEIYIRCTDRNRTIISAQSNMIGMYGQPEYFVNTSFGNSSNYIPSDPMWPTGFVPIAIHTVDYDTDYLGNADADCDRQSQLWGMAKTSAELQAFIKTSQPLLTNLSSHCKETVDIDNLWIVADAFLIENIYYYNELRQKCPWYSDDLNTQTVLINDQVELYQNGVYNNTPLMMNGLNIGLEIQKIRGGSITNDIMMHMNLKLSCAGKATPECKWINKLKYYAYSAHDTTLYAFFACLGIQSKVVTPHGYPAYSAASFIELWQDDKTGTPYFRMLYHGNSTDYFEVVTKDIAGCTDDFCPISVFQKFANTVKPDQPMAQWCSVDPRVTPTNSTTSVSLLFVFIMSAFSKFLNY